MDTLNKDLQAISQEALANPFATIGEALKDRFISFFSKVEKKTLSEVLANKDKSIDIYNVELSPGFVNKINKLNIVYLSETKVITPHGFNGNFLDYTNALSDVLNDLADFDETVAKPTSNFILRVIGKPDLLSSINPLNDKDIKLKTEQIESFKQKINLYFNDKSPNDSLPFTKVVKNQNEIVQLLNVMNKRLVPAMITLKTVSEKVSQTQQSISKSINLLLIRMRQDPHKFQMNQLTADRLSKLIHEVALEIEFFAACCIYANKLYVCLLEFFRVVDEYLADL